MSAGAWKEGAEPLDKQRRDQSWAREEAAGGLTVGGLGPCSLAAEAGVSPALSGAADALHAPHKVAQRGSHTAAWRRGHWGMREKGQGRSTAG